MEKYTIDAKGKRLGRVATEAAHHLLGKDKTDFSRNTVADVEVEILNAGQLDIKAKKLDQKKYERYSGYPGGLKERTLKEVIDKLGYEEVLEKAIFGMLPGNRLRPILMKKLKINV